jgi:hypothetical protein
VPDDHASTQADLLIQAELSGRASRGLQRLRRIVERIRNGVFDPVAIGRHEWRGDALLEVDGQMGLGPVVALIALSQLMTRAHDTGIAVAAIRNNNHLGMLAWYVERVASNGQAAITLTTSEALVHPWGGRGGSPGGHRDRHGCRHFQAIGIPRTLADLGLPREKERWVAEQALTATRMIDNNPRPLDVGAMRRIVRAAFSGDRTALRED